jgi:adenine phosphoribosyltransferase
MDIFQSLESGDKYRLVVPDLPYAVELPYVRLRADGRDIRIASFNLVGQTRLNRDLGRLLARRIRPLVEGKKRFCVLTAVEKALQLAQVVSEELGQDQAAVAYNRIKPHMEPGRRPVIQVGADSITSGDKFLAMYERDLNLLAQSEDGVILLDDVISSGGTILAMQSLVEEMARLRRLDRVPPVLCYACVATEGTRPPFEPLVSLTSLPAPEVAA